MCNLITFISLIVISYSYWYLSSDPHLNRFISYLLCFSVAMLLLVSSSNFLFTFFAWEFVGFLSYLLINFWFLSLNNNKSAIKAMLFNKVGDIFFLFGLFILSFFHSLNSLYFLDTSHWLYEFFFYSFLFAAIAKSAQIFLHPWLGDAMAGPTPVSALLHAATMVTAGVFLVIRIQDTISLSNHNLHYFILIIGSLTILFAGLSALNQYDLKKIIAFSTCSQIGFMFFALCFSNFSSLYHLLSHGFFKALLFLSAGLLIHSFLKPVGLPAGEQDIRKFGSLIFFFPLFFLFFGIGTLAIIGFLPLSGFFSKDFILLNSFEFNSFLFPSFLFLGAFLSSLYSFRLLYFSFFNTSLSFPNLHFFENAYVLYPLFFLIVGSLFFGFFTQSFFSSFDSFHFDLETSFFFTNWNYKFFLFLIPFFAVAFLYFQSNPLHTSKVNISSNLLHFYSTIFNRRLFFDTIYNYFLVLPTFSFSYHFLYKFLDRGILEFFGPLSFFRLFFSFQDSFGSFWTSKSSSLYFLFFYFFCSFLFLILSLS